MGYMTTMTILNDGFLNIKENPEEFVKQIEKGMTGDFFKNKVIDEYDVGNHCNVLSVAKSHHADIARLYFVHRNSMECLGESMEEITLSNIEYKKQVLLIAERLIKQEKEKIKKFENLNVLSF